MTTLQIRQIPQIPQPLYEQLVQRATQFHRSLTQQAIADSSQALGSDVKAKRLATLEKIRISHAGRPPANRTAPDLLAIWLGEDRNR